MKMLFTFKISDSTLNLFSLLLFIYTFPVLSETNNSILIQGQQVKDGQTIISPSQNFSLGFFSLGNSTSRYVGIWYNRIPVPTFVWVANRNNPISDRSGVLSIGPDGNLMVSDGNNTVWSSTNSSLAPVGSNVTGIMSDTGKFMVSTGADIGDDTKVLWQTSDHPTDTFLPNVRLYLNTHTGETHPFLSWKSENDPSAGNFSMGIDPRASPQVVVWEGLKRKWRSGHWNRYEFTGIPNVRARFMYGFDVTLEDDGDMYITFTTGTSPRLMRFTIQWHGQVQQLIWDESRSIWNVTFSLPSNPCEDYNRCGNFGICSVRGSSPVCDCIQGFVPKFVDQWNRGNWSGGCTRRTPLQCSGNSTETDGFLKLDHVKMPDFADLLTNMDPRSCEDACAGNCSCSAYNYLDGIGCLLWSGDLVDVEGFQTGGEVLYVHLANSELGGKGRKVSNTATIAISVTGTIVLGVFLWLTWRWRAKLKGCSNRWMKTSKQSSIFEANNSQGMSAGIAGGDDVCNEGKQLDGPPLPLLSFSSIEVATDKFADKNKLGQGGFGPVHWGILPGGQEIAVKRLSKWSGQGLQEFKNEMVLIAKLQHRNLVRLLGYCIEGEEKMLVYEYMRNKSLDTFLFDPSKKAGLDWGKRFMIIEGIARGLLYLHRDSRLRIIHRDLKVSNILLDEDMNPKISDFGMARIFGGNQNEANTNRVVGTFGYMSPEYAMDGLFSVKSDVYSFGVLLLEIISGQRNTSFRSPNCMNLIQHAWNLWMDEKTEELIDPSIADPSITKKALQCIHVAMLCVQQNAANRPTMAAVVLMLESQNASFPMPRPPDIESMDSVEMDSTMESYDITVSSNDVTVKEVTGRLEEGS